MTFVLTPLRAFFSEMYPMNELKNVGNVLVWWFRKNIDVVNILYAICINMASSEDEIQKTMSELVNKGDLKDDNFTADWNKWVASVKNKQTTLNIIEFFELLKETHLLIDKLLYGDAEMMSLLRGINNRNVAIEDLEYIPNYSLLNSWSDNKERYDTKSSLHRIILNNDKTRQNIMNSPFIKELEDKIKEINKILPAVLKYKFFGLIEKDFKKYLETNEKLREKTDEKLFINLQEIAKNIRELNTDLLVTFDLNEKEKKSFALHSPNNYRKFELDGGKGQRRRRGTKKTSRSNRRKSSRRNRRRTRRSRKTSRR